MSKRPTTREHRAEQIIQRQHRLTTAGEVGNVAVHLHEIAEHLERLTGEGRPLVLSDAPGTIADILQLRLRAGAKAAE